MMRLLPIAALCLCAALDAWTGAVPADGVSWACGIWWFFLAGLRTVNIPSGECDTLVFTPENPLVEVEVPPELDFFVEEDVFLDVESEIDVQPFTDEGVITEVDCD